MNIAALIGLMIAIVIGVNLIPALADTGVGAVLPIIFVIVIILGVIAWMGASTNGRTEDTTLPPAVDRVAVKSKQWVREHWRPVAMALVILLAWATISLLGWNS